jgi:hypothetical protein
LGVVRICFTKFLQRTKERINRVNPVSPSATRVRGYLLDTDFLSTTSRTYGAGTDNDLPKEVYQKTQEIFKWLYQQINYWFRGRSYMENMQYLSRFAASHNSLIKVLPFTCEEYKK